MNFEKVIPTEEQKDYEKRAAKRAAAEKTVLGKMITSVTGRGFNGEDVMRIDAEMENSYRNKANNETDTLEKEKALDNAKKTTNSDLSVSIDTKVLNETMVMSGKINGQDVLITRKMNYDLVSIEPWKRVAKNEIISGQIDGVEINSEQAEAIWNDYVEIAGNRDYNIARAKKNQQEK